MIVTIELTREDEARLRDESSRSKRAPESIVYGLVRDGLGAQSSLWESSPATPSPESLLAQPVSEEAHAHFIQAMLEQGVISRVPDRPGQTVAFEPITVRGEPVSETIIRERG